MEAKYCDKCGVMYAKTGNKIVIKGLGDETIVMDMCQTCQNDLDTYLFPETEEEETEEAEEKEEEKKSD